MGRHGGQQRGVDFISATSSSVASFSFGFQVPGEPCGWDRPVLHLAKTTKASAGSMYF